MEPPRDLPDTARDAWCRDRARRIGTGQPQLSAVFTASDESIRCPAVIGSSLVCGQFLARVKSNSRAIVRLLGHNLPPINLPGEERRCPNTRCHHPLEIFYSMA